MVLFRYYLLVCDTVAPSGLLARLCHAFLVKNVIFLPASVAQRARAVGAAVQ